jgi:hypothetical protein
MPRYMVTGADAETAEDRVLEIEATDADAASREAVGAGILVHRAYPVSGRWRAALAAGLTRARVSYAELDAPGRVGVWVIVGILGLSFTTTLVTTVMPPEAAKKQAVIAEYPANDDPTYSAERDRSAEPAVPQERWWQPVVGDTVVPDIVYEGHVDLTEMLPFDSQVKVLLLLRNEGLYPRRVRFRVKAIDHDYKVIHFKPVMEFIAVVEPDVNTHTITARFTLPQELEGQYGGTIVEVLSTR